MKAAAIETNGGPEALSFIALADPTCTDDGLLIDVDAVGIEAEDLLVRATRQPLSTPQVIGCVAAGRVIEIGAAAETRLQLGDRVVTWGVDGSHATRRAVAARLAWPIPDGLSTREAACVPVAFGTAFECLFTAGNLQAGQTVLIHGGSGGVGMAAIQLARLAGATVIATASTDDKLDRLKAFGLDHGINDSEHDVVKEAQRIAGPAGVDLVIDSVGGRTLAESCQLLAWRGRLVSVGMAGQLGAPVPVDLLWAGNLSLHGVRFGTALQAEHGRCHAMVAECLDRAASGELKLQIARVFPLAEAAAAHAYIEGRQAFGRVVLTTA